MHYIASDQPKVWIIEYRAEELAT